MSSSLTGTVGTPDHTPPVVYPQTESTGGRHGPDGNQNVLAAKMLLKAQLRDGSESVELRVRAAPHTAADIEFKGMAQLGY